MRGLIADGGDRRPAGWRMARYYADNRILQSYHSGAHKHGPMATKRRKAL
jgi:hypothetical protein